MKKLTTLLLFACAALVACKKDTDSTPDYPNAFVEKAVFGTRTVMPSKTVGGVSVDNAVIDVYFSQPVVVSELNDNLQFSNLTADDYSVEVPTTNPNVLRIKVNKKMDYYTLSRLYITAGVTLGMKLIDSYQFAYVTEYDPSPKKETISDEALLDKVQAATFKYFYDYSHPVSGLTRERYGSGNTVTTGGSGFGIAAIPVAIERGFITREQGYAHLKKIVDFLGAPTTDRFHGAWSHWLNGQTGKVIPFGTKDNGADLIETSFLIEGLLVAQGYFKDGSAEERTLCDSIQSLYEAVEWDWFRRGSQNKLYWHWSPDYGWDMNMPISGWNEGLIAYVLAAASPTHPITREVYDAGWAGNGSMRNGRKFYDVTLPLGPDRGGPMFFAHYSFLGLDPRNLSDAYADYWEQNTAHAAINYKYCVANPKGWYGYGENCWGLTASDVDTGYTASSPTNDVGCIALTAALASMPYSPDRSMAAMRYFYYTLGDRLWGDYGFKDAFSLDKRWFASSYLAIDQGPIIVMIENHRTGLCWDLFMANEDIKRGLSLLGFSTEKR